MVEEKKKDGRGALRNEYIVYKEGLPVCVGNTLECMKYTGYTRNSFYTIVKRTAQGILKGKNYLIYKIEENEEND